MKTKRIAVVLALVLGMFLVPMMAHADVSDVSPVNPLNKAVCIIKAYDVDAVIAKGQHLKLDAVIGAGVSGSSVTWTSSNDGVATVASNGEVIGMADGLATITAECGEFKDTLQVTVKTPRYVSVRVSEYGEVGNYQYNSFGQVTKCDSGDGYSMEQTTYNLYGLPTEVKESYDTDVTRITYTYDALMNVTKVKNSYSGGSGSEETYTYDQFGRLSSYKHTDSNGSVSESSTYDYDSTSAGVLKVTETKTDYYPDDPARTEENVYVYNAKGLLIRQEEDGYTGKHTTTFSYDKQGRLKKLKNLWNGAVQTHTYNKAGLLTKKVTAPYAPDVSIYNKCVETYTYDAQLRCTKYIEKYGTFKNVTVRSYHGDQDIPFKVVSTSYRKSGKKFKKTYKETNTYTVQAL